MSKVVRIHEHGGPEVLRLEEVEVGRPGSGEVRIRIEAIGLNRSEAAFRAGLYPVKPILPTLIGYEAAGVIEALGDGVRELAVGDRVCVLGGQGDAAVWADELGAWCDTISYEMLTAVVRRVPRVVKEDFDG